MNPITRAIHTRVDATDAKSSVTPLYQASGFEAGSTYFYSRKNNPNVAELEEVVRTLEGARHALAVTTGMTCLSLVFDLLKAGDRLVVNKHVYGCSFKLVQRLSERRGFSVKVLDLSTDEGILAIPKETRMVLFETPTNPFLKTIGIKKVAAHVKEQNPAALVVVDNTWATPLFQRPLEHGADISLHSATKYMSGHTDVMGGLVLTDRPELDAELRDTRFYTGANLDPHSAWLLRRSLHTLGVRMKHHAEVTVRMAELLRSLPQVKTVYMPRIDGVELKGYGGILFFELREDLGGKFSDLQQNLTLFGTGTGMACVTSMVAQPYNGSHASITAAEKAEMGLGPGLVRLCFGLEDPKDLEADLVKALRAIDPKV